MLSHNRALPPTTIDEAVSLHARVEAAEREARDLRALFEQAPDAMALLRGPEYVIELANPQVCRVWGRTAEEVIHKPLFEALPEIAGQGLEALLEGTLKTGRMFIGKELLVRLRRAASGGLEDVYFDFVYQPIRNDGIVTAILVVATDVTPVVLSRQRLETTNRSSRDKIATTLVELDGAQAAKLIAEKATQAMDDFLATVSHELRTPLNAMLGWTRLLRSDSLPESKRSQALETIERNANAQAQLIEDLLDVSRIISGQMRLDVVPVDLVSVIESALEVVRPAAAAKEVRLIPILDPSASHATGDSARLQQIVWNLLANAVKFTPKQGKVEIRLSRIASSVEITVTDTGQGIAPEFIGHVFDRFRQADSAISRVHGGLGLGLAIVKSLVELHGGSIRAESAGTGLGASFSVTLPPSLLRPHRIEHLLKEHPLPESSLPFECAPELRGLRILVVDDEEDARELLAAILLRCGVDVVAAGSAAEALAAIKNRVPDVVISDLGMPEADGYSLVRDIRAMPAESGGRVPVVALTAYARAEDRTRALRAGFNMHVPKPVEPSELLAVISSVARRG